MAIAFVSSARADAAVRGAGTARGGGAPAAAPSLFFFRVRFHSDLFLELSHVASTQASSSSRVGYLARSFSSAPSHLDTRSAFHLSHASWSDGSHSSSSAVVHSGKTIFLATLSPLIFLISITKIRHAAGGIFGGLPFAPYASSYGMYTARGRRGARAPRAPTSAQQECTTRAARATLARLGGYARLGGHARVASRGRERTLPLVASHHELHRLLSSHRRDSRADMRTSREG